MDIRRKFNIVERREILSKSQQCLWSEEGAPGLDYLRNKRRISDAIIRLFGLGFIPSDIRHQLRGRIIMPIINASGTLIALSSRLIDDTIDLLPKYWHESYEKNFYVYGIENAKEPIRQHGYALIVEGQYDVLQMHNHGLVNTVGLCSTNISDVQFSTISRYSNEMIFILDTDSNFSGQRAAQKVIEKYARRIYSLNPDYRDRVASISFDEPLDPDEFILKYGVSKLKQLIDYQISKIRT